MVTRAKDCAKRNNIREEFSKAFPDCLEGESLTEAVPNYRSRTQNVIGTPSRPRWFQTAEYRPNLTLLQLVC